jgi:hypothetical protein
MATVKGGPIGSINKLKAAVNRGAGGGLLHRVKEGELRVRFLTEPNEWFNYFEHYDPVNKFYPCSDDCPGCDAGDNPSQRFLANVVDIESNKVIAVVLPKTLVEAILKRYQRRGTLIDRDYTLMREGTGREDTTYDVEAEEPTRMVLSRYKPLNLKALLEQQLSAGDEDDGDDEDEAPARRRKATAVRSRRPVPDDDEDEDDDDEEPARPAARKLQRPGAARAKKEAETTRRVQSRASKPAASTRKVVKPVRRIK